MTSVRKRALSLTPFVAAACCAAAWAACCLAAKDGGVELYTCYGTTERVLVRGRALEDMPPALPEGKGSRLGNIVRTVKLLETDEIPNKPVTVSCDGREATGRTDKEGMIHVWVEAHGQPFKAGELPVRVVVKVSDKTSLEADGTALVYPVDVPLVVVSDLDDTLCLTGMDHKAAAALKTATGDSARMKPVDGMNVFLKELAQGGGQSRPVFIVSGGPVNFYPRLSAFLDRNDFPANVLVLRNMGLGAGTDPTSVYDYKLKAIEGLMDVFAKSKFILIGDSGQKDPEVYGELLRKHADRVALVLVRLVGDETDAGRLDGMKTFKDGTEAFAAAQAAGVVKVAAAGGQTAKAAPRDESLLREARAGIDRALSFLAKKQGQDGLWCGDPAITGLVVTAMVGSGQKEYGPEGEPVKRALARLREFVRPDGGIYGKFYPSYTTSICAMAFIEAGRPEDKELIKRARGFMLKTQADEGEDLNKDSPDYGGWGYEQQGDEMHKADMSNTQLAMEAVRALQDAAEEDVPGEAAAEGRTATELSFQKAITYLERCQNDDGGFVYSPDESKAGASTEGELRSYGSMTYAGLKSMVYARVDRNDKRVRAAFQWACKHWSVAENPGLGNQGLYYYYQTMAKALHVYGEDVVVDGAGQKHNWRAEMIAQLLKIQKADGCWVNDNGRWMETIPELSTSFAVLAIEHAIAEWDKQ